MVQLIASQVSSLKLAVVLTYIASAHAGELGGLHPSLFTLLTFFCRLFAVHFAQKFG